MLLYTNYLCLQLLYIHSFLEKNGDDKDLTQLWFIKTQLDVISLCLITKLVEKACTGNDLLCHCWYQWIFVLILLHAGLPALAGGLKMFVQMGATVLVVFGPCLSLCFWR